MSYQPLGTIKGVLDTMLEYISRLAPFGQVFGTNADVRVTLLSGTVTTVTTVTTVSNLTNIGGYNSGNTTQAISNTEAILGNIDNIYIS